MEVGNRFRFVRNNTNGGMDYGSTGQIGIVTDVRHGNTRGNFQFEDPELQRRVGFRPGFNLVDVELLEEAQPPAAADETTLYSFVFRAPNGMIKIYGYDTEEEYLAGLVRLSPIVPIKKMKIKVNV